MDRVDRAALNVRRLLYAAAFLRAAATAMGGVLMGFHLAALRLDPVEIGAVVGAGLAGVAAGGLVATVAGDRLGRRRLLAALSLLGAAGIVVLAAGSSPLVLGVAAFVGMVNGMGRDRGASVILDQAILPQAATDEQRTFVLAWYSIAQDVGHAAGSLLAGVPLALRALLAVGEPESLRIALLGPALLLVAAAVLYALLPAAVERPADVAHVPLTPASRGILWRISSLFALDAVGGGFLTSALLSYFFFTRFGASEAAMGALFFGARVLNAASHWGAAWLARRFGLVNTMVFTHVPSSLLLVTVAFAPSFAVAAVLFLLREGLVEMDVPTRTSYVLAVVRPEERTLASGVTNLVRLGGWAVSPFLAGVLMQGSSLAAPLVLGAGMKIAYDLLLYASFRGLPPPEERAPVRSSAA